LHIVMVGVAMRRIASKLAAATAGLSSDRVALIVVLGLVLGAFPVFGCATILCGFAALALRVNSAVLQLVNQIATPVQLVLLLPLARAGSRIFGAHAGFGGTLLNAVAGWFCLCIPAGIVLYFAILVVLRWCRHEPVLLH
jgi:hypothetical protein